MYAEEAPQDVQNTETPESGATGDKKLTEVMLLRLALRMREKEWPKIRTFVEVGLKIKSHVMNSELANHGDDFNLAKFKILRRFRDNHLNKYEAYAVFSQALSKANMDRLINESLEIEEETEIVYPQRQTDLTEQNTLEFSRRITKEIDLFVLGLIGMKMHTREVEACISKHPRDLTGATLDLLHHYIMYHHQNDRIAAYTGLCTALRHKEVKLTYLIKEVLEEKETGTGGGAEEPKFDTEALDRAYEIACKEGTVEVFNASMTLAGYHGAGKTSLATRLMGKKLDVDKSKSTEGIAIHKVRSISKGVEWEKTKLRTTDLWKDFTYGVFTKIQKQSNEEISQIPGKPEKLEPEKKIIKLDHSKIGVRETTQCTESFTALSPNESSSKIQLTERELDSKKATKIWPMSAKTRRMLTKHGLAIRNKESDADIVLTLWDLGGPDEFMAIHHIFFNVESTVLIVMDITKKLKKRFGVQTKLEYQNTPEEVLHYWLNSIHTEAESKELKPNIALILTHKNMIKEDREKWITEYIKSILKSIEGRDYAKYVTDKNIFAVDNTVDDDSDFRRLRAQLLEQFKQQENWGMKMPIRWLKLKIDCLEKAKAKKHEAFESL